MVNPQPRLIIVYNADGGVLNAMKDALHKVAAPATYPCSLCALTYGWVSMHGRWRRFLSSLPHTKVFHHRDDFAQAYPDLSPALPVVMLAEGNTPPRVLISADELDAMPDLASLIALVEERLMLARLGAPITPVGVGVD